MRIGFPSLVLGCLLSMSLTALPKVAVFDAVLSDKAGKDLAISITEKIGEELVGAGKYVVLDRTVINQSLKEIKLQMSSLTGDEEIQKAGTQLRKRLGVSSMVPVRLSLISDTYLVSARLIDVKTGEIVTQASDEDEGKASVTLRISPAVGRKLAASEEIVMSSAGTGGTAKPNVTFFWALYDGPTEDLRASVEAAFNKASSDAQVQIVRLKREDMQYKLTTAVVGGTPPESTAACAPVDEISASMVVNVPSRFTSVSGAACYIVGGRS